MNATNLELSNRINTVGSIVKNLGDAPVPSYVIAEPRGAGVHWTTSDPDTIRAIITAIPGPWETYSHGAIGLSRYATGGSTNYTIDVLGDPATLLAQARAEVQR